jgi:hypothetical protein
MSAEELVDRTKEVWALQKELSIAGLSRWVVSGDPDLWAENGDIREDAVYAVEALVGEKMERLEAWEVGAASPEVENLLANLTGVMKMDEAGFLDVALGIDANKADRIVQVITDVLPSNRAEAIHILAFVLCELLKHSSPDGRARVMLTTWTLKHIAKVVTHG